MKLSKPDYYDSFHCLAGACPDSCCKEWEVQVDDATAARYRALPGDLGDDLRRVLREEDGETLMTVIQGRCPMWRADGLCRIQAELGADGLCQVCRDFPRLRHDYGDFVELGLELSCPEAARRILSGPMPEIVVQEIPGGTPPEYDRDTLALLLQSRQTAREVLLTYTPEEALSLLLFLGCQTEETLFGADPAPFCPETSLSTARRVSHPGDTGAFLGFFRQLELLTPDWQQRLACPQPGALPPEARNFARYLVDRYWLQAVSDNDLYSRVKFILIACLLVGLLGGDFISTAQLFSKEIENDAQNMDAILDAACTYPAFTDDKLLGMLLGSQRISSM